MVSRVNKFKAFGDQICIQVDKLMGIRLREKRETHPAWGRPLEDHVPLARVGT